MRHKKARREAPGQEDRSAVQRPQQQQRRRQQQRRAAQSSAGPSASFLEALEEQRRRQEAAAQPQAVAPAPALAVVTEAAPRPRAELPGYYYDEEKRKYFPITNAYRVEQQKKQKRVRLTQQLQANELELKRSQRVATSWVRYLAERECRFGWSSRQRDRRELMPQFVSARMQHAKLVASDVTDPHAHSVSHSSLDFHSVHPVGALGNRDGTVDIFSTDDRYRAFAIPIIMSQAIGCVRWQPPISASSGRLHLAYCDIRDEVGSVFSAPSRSSRVGILPVSFQTDHGTRFSNPIELKFTDPWTIEWNPTHPEFLSVGMSSGAAYVNSDQPERIRYAPKGKVKSDVFSQSFVSDQTLLNGTRNGSSWLWDLRASRRAQEIVRNEAHSLVHIRSLQDGIRVICQTSHGELSVSDLRMMKRVLTCSPGYNDTYLPTLKFAVDETETLVAAVVVTVHSSSPAQEVNWYEIATGKFVARTAAMTSSNEHSWPLEQVHIWNSNSPDIDLWALSRQTLFQARYTNDV